MSTIGQQLRSLRISRGLDLQDVSKETNISIGLLQDLEDDQYGRFSSATYVRNFLNSYSRYLSADFSESVQHIKELSEDSQEEVFAVRRGIKDAQRPKKSVMNRKPMILTGLLSLLLIYFGVTLYSVATTGKIPFLAAPVKPKSTEAPAKLQASQKATGRPNSEPGNSQASTKKPSAIFISAPKLPSNTSILP